MYLHAGILKAVFGISASVYALIYANAFEPDGISFFLFAVLAACTLALLAIPFFNIVPFRQEQESPGAHMLLRCFCWCGSNASAKWLNSCGLGS